ncbi:MAG: phage integrase N-terminal SAM-like domain-containing protein [Halioglobus sp.]
MDDIPTPIPVQNRRFVDDIRAHMRARGYAYPTEKTYLHWIRRFILFSKRRHPKDMGKVDIEAFLNHLAVEATVSPSTQRTALNAPMYLYTKFYGRDPEQPSFHYASAAAANGKIFWFRIWCSGVRRRALTTVIAAAHSEQKAGAK